MRSPLRTTVAVVSLAALVGSCVGTDSPTGTGSDAAVGVAFQPALIPTPADGDALPINRIRISVARLSDGLLVGGTAIDVAPGDDTWSVDVSVPEPYTAATVHVFVWLINVAADGAEEVQFSGRTDPVELVPGEVLTPDVPIVRGPVANLFTTGLTITSAPAGLAEGATAILEAEVTTSGEEPPTVYWTSLTPTVLTMDGANATAVGGGTAEVVASAGTFADTVSFEVLPALVIATSSLPGGQTDVPYSQTLVATGGDGSHTWSVLAGSLPAGLTLAGVTGVISGTPTTVEAASFTAQVMSGGQTATRAFTITIASGASAGFTITETSGGTLVDESGTTDTFDVVLDAQPLADVVLAVSSGNTAEATVSPATLTFTSASWSTPQTVTVTGVDDGTNDGDQVTPVTVSVDAAASDDDYDAVADQAVSVTTTDNDGGGPLNVVTWTGGGDGTTWSDGGNWSSGAAPTASDSVLINLAGNYTVTLDVMPTVGHLTVGAGVGSQTLNVAFQTLTVERSLVLFGAGTMIVESGTIQAGDVLNTSLDSLVLNVGATVEAPVVNRGLLVMEGGTVGGPVDNAGQIRVRSAGMISGDLTATATSQITIEGNTGVEGAMSVGGVLTNDGVIELTDTGSGLASLTVTGALVNEPSGEIRALPGPNGDGRFIFAELTNRGLVDVPGSLSLSTPTGTHLNSGTISVSGGPFQTILNEASFTNQSGGSIDLTGTGDVQVYFPSGGTPPSFTNDGDITVGDGRTFLLSGAAGSVDLLGTTITNNGLFDIGGGIDVNATAFSQMGSGVLRLTAGDWNGSGTLTNPAGATLDLRQAVINGDLENRGEVYALGATVNGRLIVPSAAPATFTTDGTPYAIQVEGVDVDGAVFDNVRLEVNGSDIVRLDNVAFQNQTGTPQLWITHPGAPSSFVFDAITFWDTPDDYIQATDSDAGDGNVLTITLTNSVPADGSANTTTENGAIVNWGVPPGVLNSWTGGGGDDLWSNPNNWSTGAPPTASDSVVIDLVGLYAVTLDQNATIQSLTLSAPDTPPLVTTNGFDLDVLANITILPLNGIEVVGGTLTATAGISNEGSITLSGGTIAAALDNQGRLSVRDTSTVTGPLTTAANSTITVAGDNDVDGWLTVNGDVTNLGSIELRQGGGTEAPAILSVTGTLTNEVDANIDAVFSPGSEGRFLLTTLDNRGTVYVEDPLLLTGPPGVAHLNGGLIQIVDGSFSLSLDGGSFDNQAAGVIALNNDVSTILDFLGDATFTNEGAVSVSFGTSLYANGPGTLDMSTGTWGSSGFVSVSGGATVVSPQSYLINAPTDTLQILDATWTGAGTLINTAGGTLQLGLGTVDTDIVNSSLVELVTDVEVTGLLTVLDTATATFSGNGVLKVGGADMTGASTFQSVSLVVETASPAAFSNVSFENMDPSATQLTLIHPGPAGFDFTGLMFSPLVDGDTGFYVSAVDAAENGETFDINISPALANGPQFTEIVQAGNDPPPQVGWN